jgi:hypothetical protein
MEFVGKPGKLLQPLHAAALDDCTEVKAAIAYADHGVNDILVFDDCFRRGKKLTFYGRADGSCPIDLRILDWFLKRKSPNAVCRLVPHWLHAKVIWWVGQGAYIGSANLTDRAWFKNYEAGVYLTDAELEHAGLILELENFFEGLALKSYELTQEEYERQVRQSREREAFLKKLRALENDYEDAHWKLNDRTSPISFDDRQSDAKRIAAFEEEWSKALQKIRDVGDRVALDENRPSWISSEIPNGVQGDQFLHAYYYKQVRPISERDAFERHHQKNKNDPESALQAAFKWWKETSPDQFEQEANMMERYAPRLKELFAKGKILTLSEEEWVEGLSMVHAFGDHAGKISNDVLGLGKDPGWLVKTETLARMIWSQSSVSGNFTAREVFNHVLWGPGEVAKRIWTASHEKEYKLRHIGPNIYGELIGWARPNAYPPRNSRTSKALRALGFDVQVVV